MKDFTIERGELVSKYERISHKTETAILSLAATIEMVDKLYVDKIVNQGRGRFDFYIHSKFTSNAVDWRDVIPVTVVKDTVMTNIFTSLYHKRQRQAVQLAELAIHVSKKGA